MHKECILLNGFRKAKRGFTAGFHVPLNISNLKYCSFIHCNLCESLDDVSFNNNNNNNTGYLLHAISPKSKEHIACYKHYNKLQIHCCQKHCCETLLQLQNIAKTFHPLIQQYSS